MTNDQNQEIKAKWNASEREVAIRQNLIKSFKECPIPDNEIFSNLGLFLSRQNLSQLLFVNEIYQQLLDVHGVIMEFGVRWGRNMALYESMRGIYEPCLQAVKDGLPLEQAKALVLADPRVASRAATMQGFESNIGKYTSLAYLEAEKEAF